MAAITNFTKESFLEVDSCPDGREMLHIYGTRISITFVTEAQAK
jgi:hypothetical protein